MGVRVLKNTPGGPSTQNEGWAGPKIAQKEVFIKTTNCVKFLIREYSRWKDLQVLQDFLNTLYK